MASIYVRLFGEDVTASKSLEHFAVVAETTSKGIGKQFGSLPKYAAEATAGVVGASVYMASKFQSEMSLLSSAAGEPVGKVRAIGDGVKTIAMETGQPLSQLADGAYVVAKSFGKDGAAGQLDILRAAAQGAAAEHVDLSTATNALTSVMKGYNVPASQAVATQNQLIAASGLSKTSMQDFAGSLSSVVPLASALHVSFAEVGGAIATMTQHGETADNATQNLSNLLTNLAGQNNVASKAMQQLGINTIDLQQHLGDRGISGTLKIVEDALAKSGHGGMVVVNSFRQSANATAALHTMLTQMTPQARSLSQEWEKGDISYKTYTKSMKGLGEQSFIQSSQFKSLFDSSQGFNDSLKSGNPNISTAATQLQHMLGGVTGMRTALMLGGTSAKGFSDAVKEIGAAGAKNGHDISTWSITSQNASLQFDKLKESMQVVGVGIGSVLLPPLTRAATFLAGFFKGISDGNPIAIGVAATIGILAGAMTTVFLAQKAWMAGALIAKGVMAAIQVATLAWTGVQWVLNAALTANPIGLVVLAVGALIAVVVLLVTHWKDVCSFLQTAWQAAVGFLLGALKLVMTRFFEFVFLPVAIIQHWGQISSFLGSLWNHVLVGIGQFVIGAVQWFSSLRDRIFAFVANWPSLLFQTGVNLIQGLINGVMSMIGSVTSSIGNIASSAINAAKTALGIHSPSTVFITLGRFVSQGLQNGILAGSAGVKSAMTTVSNDLVNAFTKLGDQRASAQNRLAALERQEQLTLLQRPVLHQTSHGKVTAAAQAAYERQMAIWELRLSGIRSKVADEKTLLSEITRAQNAGTRTRLTTLLRADTAELTTLAARRDALSTQIKTATTDLDAALKTRNSYADSVTAGVVGLGDITSVKGQGQAVTATDIISSLQSQVASTNQFTSDIAKLQAEGLNQTAYKQLVDEFSKTGDLSSAAGLLSGGAAAVGQVNSLQAQLQTSASALGSSSSQALYQAGVNAAQGIVAGLQSQEAAVTAQMTKIGTDLATSFKKALGIKSPSTVMAGHGVNVVQGVIVGMQSQQNAARTTIAELFGGSRPAGPGAPYGGGGGGVTVGQINVQSGASAQEIVSELNWNARVYGR